MDAALLGADDGPAAFGLHAPMRDIAVVLAVTHRIAVRHLIETILGDLRADLDRREQNVVAGIAGHDCLPAPDASGALAARPLAYIERPTGRERATRMSARRGAAGM